MNIGINKKILIGYGLILCLFTGTIFYSLHNVSILQKNTQVSYDHPLTVTRAVVRIEVLVTAMHRTMKDVALSYSDRERDDYIKTVQRNEDEALQEFATIQNRILDKQHRLMATRTLEAFIGWRPIRNEVIALMSQNKYEEAQTITRSKGDNYVKNLIFQLHGIEGYAANEAMEFTKEATTLGMRTQRVASIGLLVSIMLSIWFALVLSFSLISRISKISKAAMEMTDGNLDQIIKIERNDELTQLAIYFNKMAHQLKEVHESLEEKVLEKTKELNQSNVELRALKDNLERNVKERTHTIEQLLYVASHDLRSPLVNIQGYTKELQLALIDIETSLKTVPLSDSMKTEIDTIFREDIFDSLEYITSSSNKMDKLLSGLLTLSRARRNKLICKQINMDELMNDVLDSFRFQLKEKKIELKVGSLPPCWGDEIQINQVFSNLIGNALKFTKPSGNSAIEITGKRKKSMSFYCIKDNGIGIAEEYHNKIFDLFKQLNPKRQGVGLGLTIVKQIVDRHNGSIDVESKFGEYTQFKVGLPMNRMVKEG